MATVESTRCQPEDKGDARLKRRKTVSEIFRIKSDIKTVLTVQQAVTLVISILLMAVTLQVPTILYYNNQPSLPDTGHAFGIDFNTCTIQPDNSLTDAAVENVEFCSPPVVHVTQNQAAAYNICLTTALALLQSLQSINSVLNNKQCQNSAVPFFCNATQVLCTGNDRFIVGLEEMCVQVRDHDCTSEWRAYEVLFNRTLPDCTSFAKDGNLTFSRAPRLVCPDTFDLYCGSFCLPSCKNYFQLSTDFITAANVIRIVALIVLGMLGGVFNLIVCVLNRRKMFQFPQIFLVYNTLIFIFVSLFLLLPLIFDHSVFLCSESNVIEAFNNPTRYCQTQGFILHAGILCFGGFLLFHEAHLLFALAFPFKARNFMNEYSKIAHVLEVIVVFALGLLPGTVVLSTSKYQIDRFPPDTCYPNVEILFHTFTLPVIIYVTIGLAMLFTVFSVLRRNHQLNTTNESTKRVTLSKLFCIRFSTPETKLFILFWYYVLVFLVILTYLTASTQAVNSMFENLEDYLRCSIAGYKPECDVYRENIKEITRPSYYLDLLTYMMTSTINLSSLTYTLQICDIKLFIKKYMTSCNCHNTL